MVICHWGCYTELETLESRVIITCASLPIMFCMYSSAIYHLFNPLSLSIYKTLIKLDYIAIGVMIFGCIIVAVYCGFHNWPTQRVWVVSLLLCLFCVNTGMQCTPCYTKQKFWCLRVAFYSFVLGVSFVIALIGKFYIGTPIEVEEFFPRFIHSFVFLWVAFAFYVSNFPECKF